MSFFAGVYCRRVGDTVPDSLVHGLESTLSRHSGEQTEFFRDDRFFLIKADVGAFCGKSFRVDELGICALAGEPLLTRPGEGYRGRSADLESLHADWNEHSWQRLTTARGVFSAAHYQRKTGALTLLTDKLGIRPLYYSLGERHVIFASAFRIMEQLEEVPKIMDLPGVIEINSFGFPLADRTALASVRLLGQAEILRVMGNESEHRVYWKWQDVAASDRPLEELADDAYRQFNDAVALRARGDTVTSAFLSGGLDSRAIVTALRNRGMSVHSFNFSLPRAQDKVFAARFAEQADTTHTEVPRKLGRPQWTMMMSDAIARTGDEQLQSAEHPRVIWSGDGGSVVLGHVYLSRAIVDVARRGDRTALIDLLARSWASQTPRWLLKAHIADAASTVRRGIDEELAARRCEDIGRCLHLFLLANDQRRHLTEHFETMDLHRLEFQLPFFDSDFIAAVLRVPVDECVGHKFYMRWAKRFPAVFYSVPWQAYPGH
ncbi:MAG TPA: asparagine synthase-related protein, partial [Gemmatimonadaceae bacterium]|nr:asparagine synthase-related protein [Gemmatimonadaceae bacterium]